MWTLRRYLVRRDFFRKVHHRYSAYRQRAERDPFADVAYAYGLVGEPAVVFDVGANIGLVTSRILRLFPSARVHAFEPTPDTARVLRQRLGEQNRVVLNELAVAEVNGSLSFNVDNKTHGGGSNSLMEHSEDFATRARVDRYEPIEVPVTTLDNYSNTSGIDHIDVLKLDIEGAELRALRGAESLIEGQAIDFIISEIRYIRDYVDQPLFADLTGYLATRSYTVFNTYTPAESGVRQALFGDAVFVSDAMRRRLQDAVGESRCGWHSQ